MNPKYERVASDPSLMAKELSAFAQHMRAAAQQHGLALTHLVVQHHWGVANAAPADAPMLPCPEGEGDHQVQQAAQQRSSDASGDLGAIHERLCDLTFRLSPVAFFQARATTPGASCDEGRQTRTRGLCGHSAPRCCCCAPSAAPCR